MGLRSIIFFAVFWSNSLFAATQIPVVTEYEKAKERSSWNIKIDPSSDENPIPKDFVKNILIDDPSQAFEAPYSTVFLQNSRVVVCNRKCEDPQNLKASKIDSGFEIKLRDETTEGDRKFNQSIIRQSTAYYWINRFFDRMSVLGYSPKRRLVVYVDRIMRDTESGVVEDNNAYFNDKDWTLSFLPAQRGQASQLSTAFDPSIVMHETSHSVFEDLVGPTLNQELLGLHEAFADYFALGVLKTSVVGLIMTSGEGLRDANTQNQYQPEMEAHDLGHVVLTALWSIRGYFEDKDLADRIAIETIRAVSKNPFAIASSVIEAHATAMKKVAPELDLRKEIAEIWKTAGLVPEKLEIDLEVLKGQINSSAHTVTSFAIEVPDWAIKEEGGLKRDSVTIGLIDTRDGPSGTGAKWYLVSVESQGVATPYWLLYSDKSKSILAAYDLLLNPVRDGLLKIAMALDECLDWNESFGQSTRDLFFKQLALQGGKQVVAKGEVFINGRNLEMMSHSVTLGEAPAHTIIEDEYETTREIRLLTVKASDLNDNLLPVIFNNEKLVGFQIVTRTGVVKTTLLQGIFEVGKN